MLNREVEPILYHGGRHYRYGKEIPHAEYLRLMWSGVSCVCGDGYAEIYLPQLSFF